MKMTLIACILAAAFFCGCEQKPDPKIAELESRLGILESNIADLHQKDDRRFNQVTLLWQTESNLVDLMQTNFDMLKSQNLNLVLHEAEIEILQQSFSNLVETMNGNSARRLSNPSSSAPMSAYKNGIPVSVYNQIASEAARRYPTDYEMQQSVIKWQVQSWKSLHGVSQ